MHELVKGKDSFWYPYFQITEKTDMPQAWSEDDLAELQDQILLAEIGDEKDNMIEEFHILRDLAEQHGTVC